jgi:hypothetical protein
MNIRPKQSPEVRNGNIMAAESECRFDFKPIVPTESACLSDLLWCCAVDSDTWLFCIYRHFRPSHLLAS